MASFSFPLLFDLLGAIRNSTRRFERMHSGVPVVCKKNVDRLQTRDSGGDLGAGVEELKIRSRMSDEEPKNANGRQSSGRIR